MLSECRSRTVVKVMKRMISNNPVWVAGVWVNARKAHANEALVDPSGW